MLIAWMIYGAAVTTIVAGCAIALDRVADHWHSPRRAIWLAALAISIVVPAGFALRPIRASQAPTGVDASADVERRIVPLAGTPGLVRNLDVQKRFLNTLQQIRTIPAAWNDTAAICWLLGSSVLVALLIRGGLVLSLKRTRWSDAVIDGHRVLVTDDIGPAVVGVIRPRILLPSWALGLDHDERALMLEHEAEHVRARDPMLTLLAAWTLALFPWNPAVWLIVRRLRLAIEIDCDGRVLASRRDDVRDYGMLLLAVGTRSANALPFSVPLAEPRRFLEQRILAMTTPRPTRPLAASTPFIAIALIAAVAVAQTPRPASTLVVRPTTAPGVEPVRVQPHSEQPIPIDVLRAWIQLHHPNIVAGDPHVKGVTIVVDENNQYVESVVDSVERVPALDGADVLVRGTLPGLQTFNAVGPHPLIIVDGVRIDSTAQLDSIPIEQVEVIKGRSAAAQYGADAESGAIIITSMRPDASQLTRLGIASENIKEMTGLRVRPGVFGPNRLYVVVLRLRSR